MRIDRSDTPDQSLSVRRDRVRAGVFRPTVQGPTMTLEQLADIEIADAMERDRKQKEAAAKKPTIEEDTRRVEHLERDGDEDDVERYEAAQVRSDAWDSWKEAHPPGSGNKGGSQL